MGDPSPRSTDASWIQQWDQCMSDDVVAMREWLDALRQDPQAAKDQEGIARSLNQRIAQSMRRVEKRRKQIPAVSFPAHLPVSNRLEDITEAISKHQVIVLSGETGSGKSTQLPKMCLAMGRGARGKIGCTQPRRVAAQSLSRRVAEELELTWGKEIGCKIRFQDHSSSDSFIKFMTDGMLLAELQHDAMLREYDTLIIDEAHERSLNIDFILGHLRQLLPERPDLKVVITSATIDTAVFSEAFGHAPVLEVSGQLFPVEVIYQPEEPSSDSKEGVSYVSSAVETVVHILQSQPRGDVLVFMPTEGDIRETHQALEMKKRVNAEVLPLFGRLAGEDQQRIFQPSGKRRVIVSTNIAETSLTLPGIRFVVDTGLARVSRYSPSTHTRRLPVEPIAQSNANQRKGRCGRVQEGVCYRLYSEKDFDGRPLFLSPEIQRCNLAEVILKMKAFSLGDMETFPFIQPPKPVAIKSGYKLLRELGALDHEDTLTEMGEKLARLPLDPTIGRMILQSAEEGVLEEMIIIAAGMSIQDPRERPGEAAAEADLAHRAFLHPTSDFLTLHNIWKFCFGDSTNPMSQNKLKKQCHSHFIHYLRIREWRDVYRQIKSVIKNDRQFSKWDVSSSKEAVMEKDRWYAAIHRSIVSGLLSQCACSRENNLYQTAAGRQTHMFPGSVMFKRMARDAPKTKKSPSFHSGKQAPTWVVAGEVVETSKTFMRMVASIQPQWVLQLGKHLCRSSYLNPRWDSKRGRVACTEVIRLNGLELMARQVDYGHAHPQMAREIFIRDGLIKERQRWDLDFIGHNNTMLQEAEQRLTRVRHGHSLQLEEVLEDFYGKCLPEKIYNIAALRHFIKSHPSSSKDWCLSVADLLPKSYQEGGEAMFPSSLSFQGQSISAHYAYAPGQEHDGVTLEIDAGMASSIDQQSLLWMIPGNREDLLHHLLQTLPKEDRRRLMPIRDRARAAVSALQDAPADSFLAALGDWLQQRFEIEVAAVHWDLNALPFHVVPRLKVVNAQGEVIYKGRQLGETKAQTPKLATKASRSLLEEAHRLWEHDSLKGWDFDEPPEKLIVGHQDKHPIYLYPGLYRQDSTISLKLFAQKAQALSSTQSAWPHFCALGFDRELGWWQRDFQHSKKLEEARMHYLPFGGPKQFSESAYQCLISYLFAIPSYLPLQRERFSRAKDQGRERIIGLWESSTQLFCGVLELRQMMTLATLTYSGFEQDLNSLFPPNWLVQVPYTRLRHYPRYLKAMQIRGERAQSSLSKEREKAARLLPWNKALSEAYRSLSAGDPRWAHWSELRWMIEEYKVSLFAQELGTAGPVSEKRLSKVLQCLEGPKTKK